MDGLLNKKLCELTSVEVLIYYNHCKSLRLVFTAGNHKCNTFNNTLIRTQKWRKHTT